MSTDFTGNGSIGNLIFLSYRRADTSPQTLALKLELERRLSAVQVFMDTSAMAGAERFPDEIKGALGAASLVVVVIGKDWLGESAGGKRPKKRRIDDSDDWVFKEVKIALRDKRAILPVLIDDAPDVSRLKFPKKLEELSEINAFRVTTSRWKSDIDGLIDLLEKRFQFATKKDRRNFPTPDTLKAKTPPYSWDDLKSDLRISLPKWTFEFSDDPEQIFYKRVNLRRDFEFRTYAKAIEFANVIAQHAADEEHHPDFLVGWKTVSVWTSTWDAGHRITPYDIAFAKYLERKYQASFRFP